MFSPTIRNHTRNMLTLDYKRDVTKIIICVVGKCVGMVSGEIKKESSVDFLDDLSWLDDYFDSAENDTDMLDETLARSKLSATFPADTFLCQSILYEQKIGGSRASDHYLIFYPDAQHFSVDVAWEGDQGALLYRTHYRNGDKDQEMVRLVQ